MSEPEQPRGDVVLASDVEREQVAARLGRAVGEGRLTLTEFSDRVGQAHAARTRADLEPLTADLPATAPAPSGGPAKTSWMVSPVGGTRRSGRWRVPAKSVAVTLIGGASLDLSDAEFAAPEVVFTVWSAIGGVSVTVPPGVRVEVEGFSVLGGRVVNLPAPGPNAPTLRIRLYSVVGGVSVSSA